MFTVSEPFARASDYRAFVKWGDGTESWASVDEQPSGGFVVDATHTYANAGTFHTTVFIVRFWHGFGVVRGTATVATPRPTLTGLSPGEGPAAGGTTVTITGTDLRDASDVEFGSNPATSFTVDSPTQITATAPPGPAGAVEVIVTTPGGTSATTDADQYAYVPAPAIAAISPDHGPPAGGTTVTITGTDVDNATDVDFGSSPAASFTVDDPTQITATAPVGTGTVDISVTTSGGTSAVTDADEFTYIPAPSVTSISPASGPRAGNTTVTITGTDFDNVTGVSFGSTPATSVHFEGPTQITAVAPAGSDTADVIVTTPSGASVTGPADQYRYIPPPVVTAVSPSSGDTGGGNTVTITGSDLGDATAVSFGSTPASGFKVDGPTQISATAPAGTGTVDVTVITPGGASATSASDRYEYVPRAVVPQTGTPTVVTGSPTMHSSNGLALAGSVNPQGLTTTAYFQYGPDSRYTKPGTSGPVYDQSTAPQQIGSDFLSHPVFTPVAGLVPNALYHARLVATNIDGTTFGPDVTFTTPADPAPQPPQLASSFNAAPVAGLVLIQVKGKFVPLTEVRSIHAGALINTLKGTLKLITATGKKHKTQTGTFGGAVFKVTQLGFGNHKGLTTLALVEGAVKGSPSYASCKTHSAQQASVAALNKKTLQLLHASDNHGKFRTKGRYSAATVRGTAWTTADRCDGTLTRVLRGTVVVNDFVRHITVAVQAVHTYLALAKPKQHK